MRSLRKDGRKNNLIELILATGGRLLITLNLTIPPVVHAMRSHPYPVDILKPIKFPTISLQRSWVSVNIRMRHEQYHLPSPSRRT